MMTALEEHAYHMGLLIGFLLANVGWLGVVLILGRLSGRPPR